MIEYGVMSPVLRAAVAVTSLKVEPGGWKPWTAQLLSGYPVADLRDE